jgi:hypothetical protein
VVLVVQRLEILDKIVKQLVLSHIAALAGAAAIDSFGVDSNTANDANSTASTSAGPNNFNMYRYQTTVLSAEGVDFVRQNYSERFTMAPRAPATETYGHPSDFVIGIVNIIFSIVDASYESDENVPLLFLLSTAPTQAPAAAGSEPLNKQAMDDSTITQSRSILVSALCSLAILAYWPHNSHLIWVKTPDFPSILMTFVNTLLKRLAQIVYKISSCVDDDMRVEFLETNKELLTFLFSCCIFTGQFVSSAALQFAPINAESAYLKMPRFTDDPDAPVDDGTCGNGCMLPAQPWNSFILHCMRFDYGKLSLGNYFGPTASGAEAANVFREFQDIHGLCTGSSKCATMNRDLGGIQWAEGLCTAGALDIYLSVVDALETFLEMIVKCFEHKYLSKLVVDPASHGYSESALGSLYGSTCYQLIHSIVCLQCELLHSCWACIIETSDLVVDKVIPVLQALLSKFINSGTAQHFVVYKQFYKQTGAGADANRNYSVSLFLSRRAGIVISINNTVLTFFSESTISKSTTPNRFLSVETIAQYYLWIATYFGGQVAVHNFWESQVIMDGSEFRIVPASSSSAGMNGSAHTGVAMSSVLAFCYCFTTEYKFSRCTTDFWPWQPDPAERANSNSSNNMSINTLLGLKGNSIVPPLALTRQTVVLSPSSSSINDESDEIILDPPCEDTRDLNYRMCCLLKPFSTPPPPAEPGTPSTPGSRPSSNNLPENISSMSNGQQQVLLSLYTNDSALSELTSHLLSCAEGSYSSLSFVFSEMLRNFILYQNSSNTDTNMTTQLTQLVKAASIYFSVQTSAAAEGDYRFPEFQLHFVEFLNTCLHKWPYEFIAAYRAADVLSLLLSNDFFCGGEQEIGLLYDDGYFIDERWQQQQYLQQQQQGQGVPVDAKKALKFWFIQDRIVSARSRKATGDMTDARADDVAIGADLLESPRSRTPPSDRAGQQTNREGSDGTAASRASYWALSCAFGWLRLRDRVLDLLWDVVMHSLNCKQFNASQSELIHVSNLMKTWPLRPCTASMTANYQVIRWLRCLLSNNLFLSMLNVSDRTVLGKVCLCDTLEIAGLQLEMVGLAKQQHIVVANIPKNHIKFLWPLRSTVMEFVIFLSSVDIFTSNIDWIVLFLERVKSSSSGGSSSSSQAAVSSSYAHAVTPPSSSKSRQSQTHATGEPASASRRPTKGSSSSQRSGSMAQSKSMGSLKSSGSDTDLAATADRKTDGGGALHAHNADLMASNSDFDSNARVVGAPSSSSAIIATAKSRLKTLEALLLDPRCRGAALKLLGRLLAVYAVEMAMTMHVTDKRITSTYDELAVRKNERIALRSHYQMDVIDRIMNMVSFCIYFPQSIDSYICALHCLRVLTWLLRAKRNAMFRLALQNIFRNGDHIHAILHALVGLHKQNETRNAVLAGSDAWVCLSIARQCFSLLTSIIAGNDENRQTFAKLFVVGNTSLFSVPGNNADPDLPTTSSGTLSKSLSSNELSQKDTSVSAAGPSSATKKKRGGGAVTFDTVVSVLLLLERQNISLETILVLFDVLLESPCIKYRSVLRVNADESLSSVPAFTTDAGINNGLRQLLSDGLFADDSDRPKIRVMPMLHFLFTLLPHCPVTIQKFILMTFCNLITGRASLANQAICTQSHPQVFDLVLDLFPLVSDESQKYLLRLLQIVGRHSISVAQLKHLFQMMHTYSEGARTYRHPYTFHILQALHGMITEDSGPRHSFVFEGESSGLKLPPVLQWPAKKGFSFCAWCRVETPKQSATSSNSSVGAVDENMNRYSPNLLCFRSHSGAGFELVLKPSVHPGEFTVAFASYQQNDPHHGGSGGAGASGPSYCETTARVSEGRWHFVAFSVNAASGLYRSNKCEVILIVDNQYVSATIEPPHMSDIIQQPLIGTCPEYFQGSGVNRTLRGQLGALYFFKTALSVTKFASIYELGPTYLYCFEPFTVEYRDVQAHTSKNASQVSVSSALASNILDGQLSSSILLCYNPAVWNGNLFLDNTPAKNGIVWTVGSYADIVSEQGVGFDDRGNYKMHAYSLQGTYHTNTQDLRMALDSLGGIKTILPLFVQSDLQLRSSYADDTASPDRAEDENSVDGTLNSPRNNIDTQHPFVDTDFSYLLFSVIKTYLSSDSNQKRNLQPLALIGFFMERLSPAHMTMELLKLLTSICVDCLHWNQALQDSLLEHLFTNFKFWRRCDFAVQCYVVEFLTTLITTRHSTRFCDVISTQKILDALQNLYSAQQPATVKIAANVSQESLNSEPNKSVDSAATTSETANVRVSTTTTATAQSPSRTSSHSSDQSALPMQPSISAQTGSTADGMNSSTSSGAALSTEQLRTMRDLLLKLLFAKMVKQVPNVSLDVLRIIACVLNAEQTRNQSTQVEGLQLLLRMLCQPVLAERVVVALFSPVIMSTAPQPGLGQAPLQAGAAIMDFFGLNSPTTGYVDLGNVFSATNSKNEMAIVTILHLLASSCVPVRLFALLIFCKVVVLSASSTADALESHVSGSTTLRQQQSQQTASQSSNAYHGNAETFTDQAIKYDDINLNLDLNSSFTSRYSNSHIHQTPSPQDDEGSKTFSQTSPSKACCCSFDACGVSLEALSTLISLAVEKLTVAMRDTLSTSTGPSLFGAIESQVVVAALQLTLVGCFDAVDGLVDAAKFLASESFSISSAFDNSYSVAAVGPTHREQRSGSAGPGVDATCTFVNNGTLNSAEIAFSNCSDVDDCASSGAPYLSVFISSSVPVCVPMVFNELVKIVGEEFVSPDLRCKVVVSLKACLATSDHNCNMILKMLCWQDGILRLLDTEHTRWLHWRQLRIEQVAQTKEPMHQAPPSAPHTELDEPQLQKPAQDVDQAVLERIDLQISKSAAISDTCSRILGEIHSKAIHIGCPAVGPIVCARQSPAIVPVYSQVDCMKRIIRGDRLIGISALRDTMYLLRHSSGFVEAYRIGLSLLLQVQLSLTRFHRYLEASIKLGTTTDGPTNPTSDSAVQVMADKVLHMNLWLFGVLVYEFLIEIPVVDMAINDKFNNSGGGSPQKSSNFSSKEHYWGCHAQSTITVPEIKRKLDTLISGLFDLTSRYLHPSSIPEWIADSSLTNVAGASAVAVADASIRQTGMDEFAVGYDNNYSQPKMVITGKYGVTAVVTPSMQPTVVLGVKAKTPISYLPGGLCWLLIRILCSVMALPTFLVLDDSCEDQDNGTEDLSVGAVLSTPDSPNKGANPAPPSSPNSPRHVKRMRAESYESTNTNQSNPAEPYDRYSFLHAVFVFEKLQLLLSYCDDKSLDNVQLAHEHFYAAISIFNRLQKCPVADGSDSASDASSDAVIAEELRIVRSLLEFAFQLLLKYRDTIVADVSKCTLAQSAVAPQRKSFILSMSRHATQIYGNSAPNNNTAASAKSDRSKSTIQAQPVPLPTAAVQVVADNISSTSVKQVSVDYQFRQADEYFNAPFENVRAVAAPVSVKATTVQPFVGTKSASSLSSSSRMLIQHCMELFEQRLSRATVQAMQTESETGSCPTLEFAVLETVCTMLESVAGSVVAASAPNNESPRESASATDAPNVLTTMLPAYFKFAYLIFDKANEAANELISSKLQELHLPADFVDMQTIIDQLKQVYLQLEKELRNAEIVVTKNLNERQRIRMEERAKHEESVTRRLNSRWTTIASDLTDERGPWSNHSNSNNRNSLQANQVFWMLDPHEAAFRQHQRLKRNLFGTKHSIASKISRGSRLSDAARDSREDSVDESLSMLTSSTGDKTSSNDATNEMNVWKNLMKYNKAEARNNNDEGSDNEDNDMDNDGPMSASSAGSSALSVATGPVADNYADNAILFTASVEIITFASNSTGGRTRGTIELTRSRLTFTRSSEQAVGSNDGNVKNSGEQTVAVSSQHANVSSIAAINPEFVWVCQAFPNTTWPVQDICGMFQRHYLLQFTAIELFFTSRLSVMMNCFQISVARNMYKSVARLRPPYLQLMPHRLPEQAVRTALNTSNTRALLQHDWTQRKISNFEYLMHLNTIAGRTFNDVGQYPVFPWVLANYITDKIDLRDPKNYRDLRWPMGAQTETQRQFCMQRYADAREMYDCNPDDEFPPFHHGTHYSCMGFVFWFLLR